MGINTEELKVYYLERQLSTREIGKLLGVSKTTILRHLKKNGIDRRTAMEQRMGEGFIYPDKEILIELYFKRNMSYEEIALIYKVDKSSIGNWMKHYKLNSRLSGESKKGKPGINSEKYKEKINLLKNGEYELIGEYKGISINSLFIHKACGEMFETKPKYFLKNKTPCVKCSYKKRKEILKKTQQEVDLEIRGITKEEYYLNGEYINFHGKINIVHKKCGTKIETTLAYLNTNTKSITICTKCYPKSKGESLIINFLDNKNIEYKYQFRIDECKNSYSLPFDFKIDNFLIEYDGEQHFKPIDHFGGLEGFIYRKTNDEIKNEYCIKNKILLIRIPFWELNNIEYILNDILKDNNTSVLHKWLVDEYWSQEEYIKLAP